MKHVATMAADLMAASARTAPKAGGKDFLEIVVITEEADLRRIAQAMKEYARLVDIITDPNHNVASEEEAEARFEEILANNVRYGKNALTLERYLGYHREIQRLIQGARKDREPS